MENARIISMPTPEMKKRVENWQKSDENKVEEIEEKKQSGRAVKEKDMFAIEDLDDLLNEAEKITLSFRLRERLEGIKAIMKSRLNVAVNFNPLRNLKASDYERLVSEEIIEEPYAEKLKKLDEEIAKFESIEHPDSDTQAAMEKSLIGRGAIGGKIESVIDKKREEMETRRNTVGNNILSHYGKRIHELERTIAEIESNPKIIERVKQKAEIEKRIFEEKMETERKEIVQQAIPYIQSLVARNENAFKRIGEVLENEKIAEELINAIDDGDKKNSQAIFDKTRDRLINSIINGDGEKQIKNSSEIVPWKMVSSVQYRPALDFLRSGEVEKALESAAKSGNEHAKKLLEQREFIFAGDQAIKSLVDPQWTAGKKDGEKRVGMFWAAFEKRAENDKQGITEKNRKAREESGKRDAELNKLIADVVGRGGFAAEAAVIKKVNGKEETASKKKCAVRLEKETSSKNIEGWRVVEICGNISGLKVGDFSPLSMSAFPSWLVKSAKRNFKMNGKDFVKKIEKEPARA